MKNLSLWLKKWINETWVLCVSTKDINKKIYDEKSIFELYLLWNTELLNKKILWVVWPRDPSQYVYSIAADFMKECKSYDIVTVSWWAQWIDMLCHTTSVSNNIPTIVVLGSWIYNAFQSRKRSFLERVIDAWGLIVSQFPLEQWSARWTFPQRNKLIVALSEALFIPWWNQWSWTALTTNYAFKKWKKVYTVPWWFNDPWSELTNMWIVKNTMIPIASYSAVFKEFWKKKETYKQHSLMHRLTKDEKIVLHYCNTLIDFEGLFEKINWPIELLISTLWILEWYWLIYQPTPWEYVKK